MEIVGNSIIFLAYAVAYFLWAFLFTVIVGLIVLFPLSWLASCVVKVIDFSNPLLNRVGKLNVEIRRKIRPFVNKWTILAFILLGSLYLMFFDQLFLFL